MRGPAGSRGTPDTPPSVAKRAWCRELFCFHSPDRAALQPDTRAVIINTPHNPTGYCLDRATLERVVAFCRQHRLILFCDEVYRCVRRRSRPGGRDLEWHVGRPPNAHRPPRPRPRPRSDPRDSGLERTPLDVPPAACDLYEHAISLGVMSKAFGLVRVAVVGVGPPRGSVEQPPDRPDHAGVLAAAIFQAGLRIGWIATRHAGYRKAMAQYKDYLTIWYGDAAVVGCRRGASVGRAVLTRGSVRRSPAPIPTPPQPPSPVGVLGGGGTAKEGRAAGARTQPHRAQPATHPVLFCAPPGSARRWHHRRCPPH